MRVFLGILGAAVVVFALALVFAQTIGPAQFRPWIVLGTGLAEDLTFKLKGNAIEPTAILDDTDDTIKLSHGFTLDTRMWDDQFEVFAQHYQVLRYDLRGFGQSAPPTTEPYSHPDDLRVLT